MVRECLDSILNLSMRPAEREIILVDDGSETSIINDLHGYSHQLVYVRQRNQGPGVARNTGLMLATGEYIQFVDADDCLVSAGYEHCLDIIRYEHPDMVLFKPADNMQVAAVFKMPEATDGTTYMRHHNLRTPVWGYSFSRRILGNLLFTPGLLNEDEEFTPLLMLRAEKIYDTDIPAYFYRKRNVSISHDTARRSTLKRLNDAEQIIIGLSNKIDSLPRREQQAMRRRVAQLTMDYVLLTVKLTRSANQLDARLKRLEQLGLYPLPKENYTTKYALFSRLSRHGFVRKLCAAVLRGR